MGLSRDKTASSTTLISSYHDISLTKRILWILNTLYYQVVGVLSILLIWIFFEDSDKSNLFFWHLLLTTTAYVPLMAAAIILFSEDNLLSLYIPRTKRYWIHGVLLSISCVAATAGIAVCTYQKSYESHRPHFQSAHAILGLISWILVFATIVTGLVAGNTRMFSVYIRPVVAKFMHNFLGIAAFAIGMGSLHTKMTQVQRFCPESVYIASIWALWYVTIWSLLAAFKSLWGQLRSIIS